MHILLHIELLFLVPINTFDLICIIQSLQYLALLHYSHSWKSIVVNSRNITEIWRNKFDSVLGHF